MKYFKKNLHFCNPFVVLMFLNTTLMISLNAQDAKQENIESITHKKFESLDHRLDQLEKAIDDILWYNKVGDVANIDKVFIVGPPPANIPNPTAMGAKNPVKF